MQLLRQYSISFIVILSLTFLHVQASTNCTTLSDSSVEFIVFKSFCCPPPFFDMESGEGFFVNSTMSQPISQTVLGEIRNLSSVAEALPILQFRIREGERGIMIEGIDTKGIENNEAILNSTFAAEMNLHSGDLFQIKDRSYTIKEIVPPCSFFPQLEVYLTFHEGELLIPQGRTPSAEGLMNLIRIKPVGAEYLQKAIAEVKELIGASALILTFDSEKTVFTAMENSAKPCPCKSGSFSQ